MFYFLSSTIDNYGIHLQEKNKLNIIESKTFDFLTLNLYFITCHAI